MKSNIMFAISFSVAATITLAGCGGSSEKKPSIPSIPSLPAASNQHAPTIPTQPTTPSVFPAPAPQSPASTIAPVSPVAPAMTPQVSLPTPAPVAVKPPVEAAPIKHVEVKKESPRAGPKKHHTASLHDYVVKAEKAVGVNTPHESSTKIIAVGPTTTRVISGGAAQKTCDGVFFLNMPTCEIEGPAKFWHCAPDGRKWVNSIPGCDVGGPNTN